MNPGTLENEIRRLDEALLAAMDGRIQAAARLAGEALACRPGCTECCVGPFPITMLDALRLSHGFEELERREPERARALRRRVRVAVSTMAPHLPGDGETGILADDDAAEEAFAERFANLPCPALDPESQLCELYAYRPMSCRSYGPPLREGEIELPPCRLCFRDSGAEAIDRCRVEPDPADEEGRLLQRLEHEGWSGDTLVAFALNVSR